MTGGVTALGMMLWAGIVRAEPPKGCHAADVAACSGATCGQLVTRCVAASSVKNVELDTAVEAIAAAVRAAHRSPPASQASRKTAAGKGVVAVARRAVDAIDAAKLPAGADAMLKAIDALETLEAVVAELPISPAARRLEEEVRAVVEDGRRAYREKSVPAAESATASCRAIVGDPPASPPSTCGAAVALPDLVGSAERQAWEAAREDVRQTLRPTLENGDPNPATTGLVAALRAVEVATELGKVPERRQDELETVAGRLETISAAYQARLTEREAAYVAYVTAGQAALDQHRRSVDQQNSCALNAAIVALRLAARDPDGATAPGGATAPLLDALRQMLAHAQTIERAREKFRLAARRHREEDVAGVAMLTRTKKALDEAAGKLTNKVWHDAASAAADAIVVPATSAAPDLLVAGRGPADLTELREALEDGVDQAERAIAGEREAVRLGSASGKPAAADVAPRAGARARNIAVLLEACLTTAAHFGELKGVAATCLELQVELLALVSAWENDALGSLEYDREGNPKPRTQTRYLMVKATREALEHSLASSRAAFREAVARCRHELAIGAKSCVDANGKSKLPSDARIAELLGKRSVGLDALALRATTDQLKSVGSAEVPEPVAELLALTAEIALKRAKRQGLALLQERLVGLVCEAVPKSIARSRTLDDKLPDPPFPSSCALLKETTLEQLAADPRRIQPALVADLGGIALHAVRQRLAADSDLERLLPTLELAISLAIRVRGGQNPRPSLADAHALVSHLAKLRCDGSDCATWQLRSAAIPLAIEAILDYTERGGRDDVAQVVDALLGLGPSSDDPRVRERAIELALLGVRALGLAREPGPGQEQDAWYAGIKLALAIANEAIPEGREAAAILRKIRPVVDAIADENTTAAVAAGVELLIALVPKCSEFEQEFGDRAGKKQRNAACALPGRFERASALLGGVASYATTYGAKASEENEEELRAARTAALEGIIDAGTKRGARHGEWVFSLGIPVGFATGLQLFRQRPRDEGDQNNSIDPCDWGFDQARTAELRKPDRKCGRPLLMPPQLEVPLGFAIQRVVGRRYRHQIARKRKQREPRDAQRWFHDGVHIYASAIDLGQFLAYDTGGRLSKPRWDSMLSPGFQVGWAFGKPDNMFVLGPTIRYAPTLFSGTTKIIAENTENPGGVLRIGLSLAYYVALFDFN